jgi:hypothetical protein
VTESYTDPSFNHTTLILYCSYAPRLKTKLSSTQKYTKSVAEEIIDFGNQENEDSYLTACVIILVRGDVLI